MLFLISASAFLATLAGGYFAIRFRDRLHLVLGFSAGAVIAVAFFDLIPEALELGGTAFDSSTILTITALGFLAYLLLDRFVMFHSHHDDPEDHSHYHRRGKLGATSLSLHSFLDGVAIGLAFQVSPAVAAVVAVAVLTHDFSDGINTVSMILKNKGQKKQAFRWLFIDAAAPVLGAFSTLFFTLSPSSLGLVLAAFAGFFLYIGASDLLPESHHAHPTVWTTLMTLLGAGVLYAAVTIAGV